MEFRIADADRLHPRLKSGGSQSLDLQRDALRAEGIEASAGAASGSGPTPPAGRRARRPLVRRLDGSTRSRR